MSEVIIMEELLKVNDKQDMNKYENSINRVSFKIEEITSNLGLDLDDQLLSEDIKNIHELLDRCNRLEKALDKASEILEEGYGEEYASYVYMKNLDEGIEIPAHMNIGGWKEWLMKDENKN